MVGLETMAAMSAPRVCPSCSEWLCGADDAFCGACGRSCARIGLEAIPSVLPLGHVPPRVGLRLVNPTCASMRITQVIAPQWLEVTMPATIDVKPGASTMLLAKARTFSLRQPESSEVEVQTSFGGVRALMMVIQDPPALAMSPSAIQYWSDRAGTARLHEIDIHPVSGHLRARRLIDPVESWARLRTTLREPIVIGRDKPLRVSLQLDADRMPPLRAGLTRTLRTRIGLEYDGPHGPGEASLDVDVEVRRPPELTWTGEHTPPRVRWR